MVRAWLAIGLVCLVASAASTAQAFCGFYVAGADTELFNNATMVVMMREGTTTYLSMQNDYQGPAEDFAMVVPVPVVLDEAAVKTLPKEVFDRIDTLAAPRLVEYWEQDPCREGTIGLGNLGTIGHGAGGGSGYGRGAGRLRETVRVEAEFAVGEYDIVMLSATDSSDLETWLRQNGYHIPEGASEALRPYVESDQKFFVAKVDTSKVTFDAEGRALLSPLRIQYDSDTFALPVRLGMLNSSGTQDLVVHILARGQRYEVANYENVTIPTNIDVADTTRERFGEFYAALFDQTLEHHQNAVVTEYSWQATGCDPCPGPVLSTTDLVTLGAGDGDPPTANAQAQQRSVTGGLSEGIIRRIVRRHINEVRFCMRRGGAGQPVLRFTVEPDGRMGTATSEGTSGPLTQCLEGRMQTWQFPTAETPTQVVYPVPQQVMASASGMTSFVLTRLHYRYGRGELGEDLVFRPAPSIVGGREMRNQDNELERGATEATFNNFQGRYIIRHAWEGEIACENPTRNVWGGPPSGGQEQVSAASRPAAAPRGQLALTSFLRQTIPAIGVGSLTGAAGEAEAVETDEAQEETPSTETVQVSTGCGGCSAGGTPGAVAAVWLMLLARRRLR